MIYTWILLLCFLISPARAEDSPPLDEYNNVKPGLLLEEQAVENTAIENNVPEENLTEALTIEEILADYKKGDYARVAKYITPLAENGLHQGEELLGIMYKMGQGVEKSPQKAFEWLAKAAEANRPLAQHHLGVIYFTGDGVSTDPVKALMWLYIAITHYPPGAEKTRAQQDRDGIYAQLNRRDRDRALEMAREWLDKKGEGHLLETQP